MLPLKLMSSRSSRPVTVAVPDRSQIGEIEYHALLAELPIQQVQSVLTNGAAAIRLLSADEVMFVSPFTAMNVEPGTLEPVAQTHLASAERIEGRPRVALLDGLPFANHDALQGRLSIDDPDELGRNYPVAARHHGTAMASLIIHGDLTDGGQPLDRPLYVRPILQPHEFVSGHEQVIPNRLLTDVLHRAVKRIVKGEGNQTAAAPSVRVVNLSIGAQTRALTRRMSPVGRLLDWLAYSYNLLFVVSAGNHTDEFMIPADAANDADAARLVAMRAGFDAALLRGILPPGDALNALTVGATHSDGLGEITLPDTVRTSPIRTLPRTTEPLGLALIGHQAGPPSRRWPCPLHTPPSCCPVKLRSALALRAPPRQDPAYRWRVPGRAGASNSTVFTNGTSNATALVTREASRLFDLLEAGNADLEDTPLPDPQYHPLLVRALLVHASSWASGRRVCAATSVSAARTFGAN